jgi:hypothetical protein
MRGEIRSVRINVENEEQRGNGECEASAEEPSRLGIPRRLRTRTREKFW